MSKPISRNLVNSILRNYVKVQDNEDEFYNWNWRKSYYNSIKSPSVNSIQSHIDSKEPFFVMGIRKAVEISTSVKEYWSKAENITKKEEKALIEIAQEQMRVELVDLKELLLAFGLGIIPLKGVYKAKDSSFSLGVEMSVFVPMSPNFTGYGRYPDIDIDIIRNFDFLKLAIDLREEYKQNSILTIDTKGELGLLNKDGSFDVYKENIKRLTDEDVDMYMSQLNRGRDNDLWWTLEEKDLTPITSSLYDGAELEILCG